MARRRCHTVACETNMVLQRGSKTEENEEFSRSTKRWNCIQYVFRNVPETASLVETYGSSTRNVATFCELFESNEEKKKKKKNDKNDKRPFSESF